MTVHQASAPSVADIEKAADRLAGLAVRTPLIESPALNDRFNARILFKPEVLQRTGSFKFRGAYNRISQLSPDERGRGVVAFSSGNHAQGVAAAAGMFDVDAVIAMPSDTPQVKVANVEAMGASVIRFDRFADDRMAVVKPYMDAGRILVPPFDDPAIIAGQGTLGLEILADMERLGAALDIVVAPCGGGGLIAGLSLAVKARLTETAVWAVEPEGFDDTRRSLAADRRVANEPGHTSICDAILTPSPGEITFEINRRHLAGAIAVSDAATAQAMRDAALHLKLVVEPGGAVGLAALSSGEIDIEGKCVVVVLSGGNVDPVAYARLIAA
ncbi:threonine ammonia-lyase [Mesorhizobium xinjiangense]|uniref:threonine ammonia-lyase n=1 Tax=Mesorhizobium xinjiangense TaxID=2678685 RepID=UPI0012EDFFE3|nr:threonine/serine dehydratase [Mesorhizobium xinjiangense]